MYNVIKLTEEQKDAFFKVIKNLPENIYPLEDAQSPIEKMIGEVNREGLSGELLKNVKHKNVFLRIIKNIKFTKDLKKTEQELIAFYNDPKNENIWRKEH